MAGAPQLLPNVPQCWSYEGGQFAPDCLATTHFRLHTSRLLHVFPTQWSIWNGPKQALLLPGGLTVLTRLTRYTVPASFDACVISRFWPLQSLVALEACYWSIVQGAAATQQPGAAGRQATQKQKRKVWPACGTAMGVGTRRTCPGAVYAGRKDQVMSCKTKPSHAECYTVRADAVAQDLATTTC